MECTNTAVERILQTRFGKKIILISNSFLQALERKLSGSVVKVFGRIILEYL